MATLLQMPEVITGSTEAVLSHWLVPENSPFEAGAAIAVVETEKATVDIEADTAAKLVRSLVPDGATVTVGTPLAVLAAPDEEIGDADAVLAELGVGSAPAPPAPAATTAAVDLPAAPSVDRIFATPLVRRLARDAGVDLATIPGSGPNGRIVRRDFERAQRAGAVVAPAPPVEPPPPPPSPAVPGIEQIPHTRLRRAIARRLVESKQSSPHFYLRGSARIDALLALRAQVNEASAVRISVNDFLVKAAALAHARVPDMNVVWSEDALLRHPTIDIGVAIASARGLVTPVLRVGSASLSSIASQIRDLAVRADGGGLAQSELEGGTLTISNLGMHGVEEFAAIINPPQAAILAVGAARREPVVLDDGTLGVATVLRVTLSVDHRAVDGALAAGWMREFIGAVEQPLSLLV